jgi:hypothetical protein
MCSKCTSMSVCVGSVGCCCCCCLMLIKLEFSQPIFENFTKIRTVAAELFRADGRTTVKHDDANSHFRKFYERDWQSINYGTFKQSQVCLCFSHLCSVLYISKCYTEHGTCQTCSAIDIGPKGAETCSRYVQVCSQVDRFFGCLLS